MQAKAKKYYGQTCTGTLFGSENERNNAEPIHNKTLAEELQQLSLNERQKAVQVIREVENNYNVAYAADELNNLPAKERERVLFDLHGIIHADADADHHPMEDDNLEQVVDRALAEMDTFLAKENKTPVPYQFAMLQSPDYVQDRRFRLSFLRAERFDAKRAAAKVLKFFELKLDLFGRELLCKDIQLKDLTKDDLECLKHGNIQILPARDRAGRSVVFACPAFFQYKTHDNFVRVNPCYADCIG